MKDLLKLDVKALAKELAQHKQELERLQFAVFAGEEKGVRKVRDTKKTIARIKTRLAQLAADDATASLTEEQK